MLKNKALDNCPLPPYTEFLEGPTPCPLFQLNPNTPNAILTLQPKHTIKRNLYAKKALTIKLQKAQHDHCCIDIVNRKQFAVTEPTDSCRPSHKASNIELLKKQIEYLQKDRLKWQKFPKEELLKIQQYQSLAPQGHSSITVKMQSLDQATAENSKSLLLQGFANSFNKNFFIAPLKERPLTCHEKQAKIMISTNRKKSLKKCMAIVTDFDKQNLRKTIHSKNAVDSPFRKYFMGGRSRRNSSCGAQLIGKKMKKFSLLDQERFNAVLF